MDEPDRELVLDPHPKAGPSGHLRRREDLIAAIRAFIAAYNRNPTPFLWTKTADQILAKALRKDTSETEH